MSVPDWTNLDGARERTPHHRGGHIRIASTYQSRVPHGRQLTGPRLRVTPHRPSFSSIHTLRRCFRVARFFSGRLWRASDLPSSALLLPSRACVGKIDPPRAA
jgi:hypothetical protein